MSVVSNQLAVTATAAIVVAGQSGGVIEMHLTNSGANPIQLGPSSITGATGFTLAAGVTIPLRISGDDVLYAVSALGSTLQVLAVGEVLGA